MKVTSHPDRWIYGGVLVRIDWVGDPGTLLCWDGSVRPVREGDRVVALKTASKVTPVEIEQRRTA